MTDNVQVIKDVYAAFGRGDIDTVLAAIADDADWRGPATKQIPYAGSYRGKSGAADFFKKLGAALRVTAWQPMEFVGAGDDVMTTGSWSGVALETGKSFTSIWAMHFKLRNGKIVYFQTYEDTASTAAAFVK